MTLAQSKPGLVLVALEEMPSDVEGNDPKQDDVGRLIGMRFSGRKGDLKEGSTKAAPRNSGKRGEISFVPYSCLVAGLFKLAHLVMFNMRNCLTERHQRRCNNYYDFYIEL